MYQSSEVGWTAIPESPVCIYCGMKENSHLGNGGACNEKSGNHFTPAPNKCGYEKFVDEMFESKSKIVFANTIPDGSCGVDHKEAK